MEKNVRPFKSAISTLLENKCRSHTAFNNKTITATIANNNNTISTYVLNTIYLLLTITLFVLATLLSYATCSPI
jgi:ABC-type phosphate transport system permease subunit